MIKEDSALLAALSSLFITGLSEETKILIKHLPEKHARLKCGWNTEAAVIDEDFNGNLLCPGFTSPITPNVCNYTEGKVEEKYHQLFTIYNQLSLKCIFKCERIDHISYILSFLSIVIENDLVQEKKKDINFIISELISPWITVATSANCFKSDIYNCALSEIEAIVSRLKGREL